MGNKVHIFTNLKVHIYNLINYTCKNALCNITHINYHTHLNPKHKKTQYNYPIDFYYISSFAKTSDYYVHFGPMHYNFTLRSLMGLIQCWVVISMEP